MATVRDVATLTGDTLDWAMRYARTLEAVMGEMRRALKADHAKAEEAMQGLRIDAMDKERLLVLAVTKGIVVLEDGDWYAVPNDFIAMWRRDLDGDEALAMIFEEDAVRGDSYETAIKRCYIRMVLGPRIEIPGWLPQ